MGWTSYADVERYFEPELRTDTEGAAARTIQHAARQLCLTILEMTPQSADQSAAVRQVREAAHTAIDAIACQRRPDVDADEDTEPASEPGPNAYLGGGATTRARRA